MEQLNKVELIGHVGGSVRTSQFGERTGYFFSVATNYAYKDRNGELVSETTWHNITYYSKYPLNVEKGKMVHVIGRIRNRKYTGTDGIERMVTEILANSVELVVETSTASASSPSPSYGAANSSSRQDNDLPEAFL